MGFAQFLIEDAAAIADAKKHLARCHRGYKAAVKKGDKQEAAEWDSAIDDADQQLKSLMAAASKK